MADDIYRWSDDLARDPGSLSFLPLGEALRRQGRLDMATRVAVRGVARHPRHPDAHDLLARIYADAGDLQKALDEWEIALRLAPDHTGALKGLAFVCFQQQRFDEAEEYLRRAAMGASPDGGIGAALDAVRRNSAPVRLSELAAAESATNGAGPAANGRPGTHEAPAASEAPAHHRDAEPPAGGEATEDPRRVFAPVLGAGDRTALLLDASGFVLAGTYMIAEGRDVASEVGAQLSGVSDEASRATRHLGIGAWKSIVFETEAAVVAMSPTDGDALVVLAASPETPLGLLRRLLDRCAALAHDWMARQARGTRATGGREDRV